MFVVLRIRCNFVTTNTETELFKLQKIKIMTTSTLLTETYFDGIANITTYSFFIISTETKVPIGEYQIWVEECDGEVCVKYVFDTYVSKEKFFSDELDAHMYAMSLVKKFKAKYN